MVGCLTMVMRFVLILAALGIVQCKLINTCSVTKKFVDGHNSRRLQLAKGEVAGQPAASRMTYVIWDEKLAEKARKWALKNKFEHNPDKSHPVDRFYVGENIYWYGTTDKNYNFNPDTALANWFDEYEYFSFGRMSTKDFASSPKIGHYTQMAWANSTRVGCGISQYTQGKWLKFFVVCNYGPGGNIIGQAPYKTNGASGRLVCGEADCSRKYGEFC